MGSLTKQKYISSLGATRGEINEKFKMTHSDLSEVQLLSTFAEQYKQGENEITTQPMTSQVKSNGGIKQ